MCIKSILAGACRELWVSVFLLGHTSWVRSPARISLFPINVFNFFLANFEFLERGYRVDLFYINLFCFYCYMHSDVGCCGISIYR